MSDGYPVIAKLAAPPNGDYHSGASLIFQGNSIAEVAGLIGEAVGEAEVGKTIVEDIVAYNLSPAVARSLRGDAPKEETVTVPADAPVVTEEPASDALLKVVAKKTGTDFEELKKQGLTKAAALELQKGGK